MFTGLLDFVAPPHMDEHYMCNAILICTFPVTKSLGQYQHFTTYRSHNCHICIILCDVQRVKHHRPVPHVESILHSPKTNATDFSESFDVSCKRPSSIEPSKNLKSQLTDSTPKYIPKVQCPRDYRNVTTPKANITLSLSPTHWLLILANNQNLADSPSTALSSGIEQYYRHVKPPKTNGIVQYTKLLRRSSISILTARQGKIIGTCLSKIDTLLGIHLLLCRSI